jgi:ribonuclease G
LSKELIIHAAPHGIDVALLEDKKLTELHQERHSNQFLVGDIYLAKIRKIMPGLNAAFIDIGYERDAFLHYTDLSPDFRTLMKFTGQAVAGHNDGTLNKVEIQPEIEKGGNIKDILANKTNILVQILKEPISTKGPRLTCEITLAGRYLVLSPFTNSVGVSRKIDSADERKRLKVLVESLKPKNFGVIVRTVAEGKDAKTLHEDLLNLEARWAEMCANMRGAQPVKKVLSEVDKTSALIRDILNPDFERIVTNSPVLAKELEQYISVIAPDKKGIVSKYNGNTPLFDHYGITKQIKSTFSKKVEVGNSGAYLIIEKTEACHVIDVNSGHRVANEQGQENNALQANLEVAEEITRQMRLRDLGGIIVIDFIDMKTADNKRLVYEKIKELMSTDKATHTILPLSKFNLMEITRERVRPEIQINTTDECPTCAGSGTIKSTLLLSDDIDSDLTHILQTHNQVKLYVHPIIEAYLKRGIFSIRARWSWKFKKWIRIYPNENISFNDYKFFDENDEEIILE